MTENKKLDSRTLAVLIVDALVDAEIVRSKDTERAIEITIEEIDARKAAGDY